MLNSRQTYVPISGTITDNPDGTRNVFLPPSSIDLGDNEMLILLGNNVGFAPFSAPVPVNINAFLQQLPSFGSGAPSPTPEPSSLWLAATGLVASLGGLVRRRM